MPQQARCLFSIQSPEFGNQTGVAGAAYFTIYDCQVPPHSGTEKIAFRPCGKIFKNFFDDRTWNLAPEI